MIVIPGVDVSADVLAELCRRYEIKQLSLFGSLVRGEARADSDADVLVEYRAHHRQSLFEFMDLQQALSALLGRDVDLVSRDGLSPHIGPNILSEARPFYAAD